MAPNKGCLCLKWRGLFSVLVFLTTITSHHRAQSYSNHINIDDIDEEDVASTTTSFFQQSITFPSFSPSREIIPSLETSSSAASTPPPMTSTTAADSPLSTISFEQHNGADASEIPYQFNFSHPIYNATIPENSVQKTLVVQPYTDKARMGIQLFDDGVHSIDVKYQIVGGDKNKVFKAEERIVGNFAFLTIRTRTNNIVLNREKGDGYRLIVKATIARSRIGTKKRSVDEAETIVDVKVLDKNDLSPLFYPTKYSITVTDDTPLHQSILRVTAEDADIGINGEIYYSLLNETEQFSVHPSSGVLTLTRSLESSGNTYFQLTVLATDRASLLLNNVNSHSSFKNNQHAASKASVEIFVQQTNLHSPEIHLQALNEIVENSNANIYGIVRVTDGDKGLHGEIKSLEIVDGDPDGHFRIKPSARLGEFVIEIHKLLDRETTPNGYNLTLRAVDKGVPPRDSYKRIPVRLIDFNDNKPVFNREIYEVSVPEIAPINTPVIRLKVSDRDDGKNAQVYLQIVGGNENGEFKINPETGMLYTNAVLDAETKHFYTLTVSAIDQGNTGTRKQSSAKVKINIEDRNDENPVFEKSNMTIWVDENEPAGSIVTKVKATDADSSENAYVSYSIANLNEVPFDIDHFSGSVRTSKLLDYETMRREYVLSIRASDWGQPYRRQTEMKLFIKLRNVNDHRPQFERIDCVGQIPRHLPIGSELITLSAIDFDAGDVISYRIVSGNEDGCFNLESASGLISLGCDLQDLGVDKREVNVTATDGTHFADNTRIQINLISNSRRPDNHGNFECRTTDVARKWAETQALAEKNNAPGRDSSTHEDFALMPSRYGENIHAPEFINFPLEIKVNETVALGTTIAWIKARDRDLGYNGKLVYGISDGDNDSLFRLDLETGELKVIGFLDREKEEEYLLNVTVYDLGFPNQKSISRLLPISVLDENDCFPTFEKSIASLHVSESARNGSMIFRFNATDRDKGLNGKVTYSLITDTKDFSIDRDTGILSISAPLDREKQDLYELRIKATDGGEKALSDAEFHSLSSEALLQIKIDDFNDNAPQFHLTDYNVRVREDIPIGTVVVTVTANDLDIGNNGEILYTFDEAAGGAGDGDGYFKIDKHTGTIRTAKQLDFEERQIHSLIINAIDKGIPTMSSSATLIVEVIDVNENRFAPQFEDFVMEGSVKENQSPGAQVMKVAAKDYDLPGPDSRVSYTSNGGDGLGLFAIDNEGNIRTMVKFDAETKSHYWLTICAQDHGIVPLHSCIEVFIQIDNENDNVPLTEQPVYYPSVPENSPAGTRIIQLDATDDDKDPDQRISYRLISGNPEGFFSINTTTGLITTTSRRLDRENQPEHILEVMIMDDGEATQLSSTTRVVIKVQDINDNAPEFDQKTYNVEIPSNAKINQKLFQDEIGNNFDQFGSVIPNLDFHSDTTAWEYPNTHDISHGLFRVLAFDKDEGDNGRVKYSIKSGKGKAKFRIHPDNGIVYAAKNLDQDAYDLTIKCEDNGNPKKVKTTTVHIEVVQVTENSPNAPKIISPDQSIDVTESDQPGYLITDLQVEDEDGDHLWFDIIEGDDNNDFYIGESGNLLLAKKLDGETKREYNLSIGVTDGTHIVKSNLFISVINSNEHRPEFTEQAYRIEISENTEKDSEILQLHATDADDDKKLFYSLHTAKNPASLALFRVDSVSGVISLIQKLDRELIAEHLLVVSVKDQGTPAKRNFAKVIIKVHDFNNHIPEFTSKLIQGKVYETASVGTRVVQVYAIDRDAGDNAKITYSIVSGNIGNAFEIDEAMGIISVVKELDIQALPEYMLQVKASDSGKPSLSSQIPVHIMVQMADNAPPRFITDKKDRAAEIYENLSIGSFVKHLEVRSTSSVLFEIISGNELDVFFINPSTGIITTKDEVDYERSNFFNLTILATNMASKETTCNLIIQVLDKNDNNPTFEHSLYRGEISESAPIGSLVTLSENGTALNETIPLVIKARDNDSGQNALLHFDIVEYLPRKFFHIDSSSGAIKNIFILDYEKIPFYSFNVKVSDLGKPRLTSVTTARVEIKIINVNDCAPTFKQKEYNATLLLPTYENVAVIQVNATDKDMLDESMLRYDIIDGNADKVFAINPGDGTIVTTRNVDKIMSSYKLHVRVSDGKYSTISYVFVRVENSENSGLVFQKSVYENSVAENSTKIQTVCIVNVLGTALNEHVEFRILNPTEMFKIGLTSGAIETTGERFDREEKDNYELIVEAKSQMGENQSPRVAHVVVKVSISDENDNCPIFVNLPYYAVVSVDDPKGSAIIRVQAIDLDAHENGEVRYEMKKGHGELFKVDRKTGEVILKQTLEGHNKEYQLLISAFDGGIIPCSTDVVVNVKTQDKNMPTFSNMGKNWYSDTVPENIELHSPLSVQIQATSPMSRKLIYSIVKGNELEEFAVDFNTASHTNSQCAIYVVDELDFETKQNYDLIIRATDSVSGVYAEVPLSIAVSDVNDCPPTLPQDNYDITVSESAPFGSVVLKVAAQDNDGPGMNSEITYSIQTDNNKNSSEFFHIDENEGTVYLKKSLDHETLQHHHFTIRVADKGSPALSSTAHVTVSVSDSSDNPPFFEQLSYECVLSQEATRGQFVTVLSADDPDYIDSNKLIYTIVEGNEQQTYHMDPFTGIITLMNMQNFGDTHIAVLNVSVTDGVYTSYTRVKIAILPANLHNPQFEQLVYEAKVTENQLAGRLVASVRAKDKDFGKYGKLAYAIVSEEMREVFDIDSETGDLITKVKLDREARKSYDVLVMATDEGGRSGFTTVRVSVTDENEFPPQFINTEYKTAIHANLSRNIVFMWIRAIDADENENAAIKYTIYDSENKGVKDVFGINEHNGGVYLKFDAEKFENQMFQFFVRAHDQGSPSLHSDVPVDVYVMAPSEQPPVFEKKEKNLFLSENSEPGTLISRLALTGNVSANFRIISADDPDDPQFTINGEGELKLGKTLDRESKDLYYINILAETDSSPPLTAVSEIELRILDVNDVIPSFESSSYLLAIAENIEKGSSILKVHAHDADSGSNGNIRYSLDKNAGDVLNIFDIDSYTGWLTTLVSLDKEKQDEYKFNVIASDNGPEIKHSTKTSVTIRLVGYNDNPMKFKRAKYEATVNENSLPGTVLVQLEITDKDGEADSAVDFYITSGDLYSQFAIRQSGELYVAKQLDREAIDRYQLSILVTDGKFIDTTNVTISVQDSNDNPMICLKYRYRATLSEDVEVGRQVLTVEYIDVDEPANTRLRFYLTGNGAEDFHLDEHTGVLKTARSLNRENQSRYKLTAFVQDRDHFGWECSSLIEISLTDVNDEKPIFTMESYNVFIPEDAEVGSLVTKVLATDNDKGVNRKIRYSFIDSHKEHFKIEPESGIVTLMKPLDREQKALYNLTLRATDQGEPNLSSTTSLVVNVQDINDSPPVFTSNHYAAKMSESESIGTSIVKLLATSNDIGVNAEISYAIIGGNDHKKFTIDKESGVVSLADLVDFERSKDYFLTVQATDGGTPPLSSLATLNISIADFNDNAPQFSQSSYQARIREDAEIGDKILQVRANDLDADENGKIRYSIEKGDRMNQFNIEEDTGYISVANELDRETISNYVLEVVAKDSGFPELSSIVLVNLDISDANDNYPTFAERNYTTFVQENKAIGHHLMKFEVIDIDASPNAEPFTFEFISGNENGAFRIDEQDGSLKTATKFNHKIKDTYRLKIRVFDNGSPVLYSDTEVTVKIIEESQYPPYVTPLEIYINSFNDEYPGGKIGKVFATDQDSYDTLTFDLASLSGVSYKPNALFNISKEDGQLYAYPRLDAGEYRINVTVSDNKFVSSAIIKVSVEIVSDEMLQNAISIRARNISPEEFVLSKRKTFIRALKDVIHCRLKDIILISVQKSFEMRSKRQAEKSLDVLFAVRKTNPSSLSATTTANFHPPNEIRKIIEENLEEIEDMAHIKITEVIKAKCLQHYCVHGECEDKVIVDAKVSSAIATDMFSFASAQHEHRAECNCKTGFGGDNCQFVVNECAKDPCKQPKRCVPDKTERGYHCACDEGFFGTNCDKETSKCNEDNCYNPRNPVTFSGKSYAHYKIDKNLARKTLEEQIQLQLRVRTVQLSGNLMYAAGKVDYMILEIQNGVVQLRFELGSGEGLVSVTSIFISDGLWHEIRLEREGNSARLIIDGKHTRTGVSPGVNGILNVQSHDLYFGAEVRNHPLVIGIEDVQRGFIGCLDDLKLSRATLPLQMNAAASSSVAVLKRFANVDFNCEASNALVPLGICRSQSLCFNGGTCKEFNNGNDYECLCHDRFNGKNCQEDRDPCSSSPCLFGGKCRDEGFGNYTCECPARMSGRRCDFGRFCLPNPCRHSGVCEEGDDGPICMCRGYTGKTCEVDVDECANNPCLNGATCVNEAGSFRCICPSDLKSCGDPLYSNSIISNLINNTSFEQKIIFLIGTITLTILLVCLCLCCCCKSRRKSREEQRVKNNVASPINSDYKRVSKMSNLEVVQQQQANQQRPVSSYAATGSDHHHNVPYNPIMQYNNLDTLRNYGSAGDELENLPPEYRKLNRNPMSQQMVNINNTTGHSSDTDTSSMHKQANKWDQIHLQTFSDNTKINNDKRLSPHHQATNHYKQGGVLQGRLLPSPAATYAGSTESGAYEWDVSDWKPRSLNVLSNITEVPGSEVIDSSSFHSNESNESNGNSNKNGHLPPNVMMESISTIMDPSRDIETLNENIEHDFPDSECDQSEQPLSINFDQSMSYLNPLDSGSDVDYRFNTAESYVRHPNSYLPKYNIQSETDGESISLTQPIDAIAIKRMLKNGIDIGPHQIIQSDEEEDDVQAYGFPSQKRRNRVQQSDLELELSKGGESSSLLGHTSLLRMHGDQSQSDLSVKLCEIEDSETDELNGSNNYLKSLNTNKSNWTKTSTHTDV